MSLYTDADGVHPGDSSNASYEKVYEGTISVAEMLALRATPKTLAAAPGAGKVIEFLSGVLIYDYAAAFTETSDNLAVRMENGSGAKVSEDIEAGGFLDATADKIIKVEAVKDALLVANKAIVLHNIGDGELGGTGSPLRFKIKVAIHETGL